MKTICKKISVSILTLLMIMTMYLSGSGESLFLKNRDVKAFTGEAKLVMSQALSNNKISEIDRPLVGRTFEEKGDVFFCEDKFTVHKDVYIF